jgi:hypothetical protein
MDSTEQKLADSAQASLTPKEVIPTLSEIKQARRVYWTVRNPIVQACGHKLKEMAEPKNNCEYCWFTFFNTYGELTKSVDEAFREHGKDFVVNLRGTKFVKNFTRFMSTLSQLKEMENGNS